TVHDDVWRRDLPYDDGRRTQDDFVGRHRIAVQQSGNFDAFGLNLAADLAALAHGQSIALDFGLNERSVDEQRSGSLDLARSPHTRTDDDVVSAAGGVRGRKRRLRCPSA